jgi:hypothetical protein
MLTEKESTTFSLKAKLMSLQLASLTVCSLLFGPASLAVPNNLYELTFIQSPL